MHAKIQPVQVFPSTATVLFINNVTVQPGASASYQWWLQTEERGNLTTGVLSLAGEAYAAWGTDDEYLYTFTAATLGLTITEIVPDAAPTSPVAPPAPVEAPAAPPVVVEPVVAPVVVEEPVAPVVEEPVAPLEADPAAGSI